jgi:DNA-binding NtrC family response regulator
MLTIAGMTLCHCRGRILVVDQDDWCREFLSQVIKLGDFGEYFLATSVEEALAHLDGDPFDLLITDLKLPHHHRLVEDCRQRFPGMRLILMLQKRSQIHPIIYMEQMEVVIKPLSLDEMTRKIREALHSKHRLKVEEEIFRLKQEGFRF